MECCSSERDVVGSMTRDRNFVTVECVSEVPDDQNQVVVAFLDFEMKVKVVEASAELEVTMAP